MSDLDLWAAQSRHLDDPDFCAALRAHWRRVGMRVDREMLIERGYLWRPDCWAWRNRDAAHVPTPDEMRAMEITTP